MTARAREVLEDARIALTWLDRPDISRQEFRITWVALCSLLRATGHVLQKVDAPSDKRLAKALASMWPMWKGDDPLHAIFRDFIDLEWNAVLKTYEKGYFDRDVAIVIPSTDGTTPDLYELDEGSFSLFTPMTDGHFTGQDCRDVAAGAIEWWDKQLTALDEAVRNGV